MQTVVTIRLYSKGNDEAAMVAWSLNATNASIGQLSVQTKRVWDIHEDDTKAPRGNACTGGCLNGECLGTALGISTCGCHDGWTGPVCNIDHNECTEMLCQNAFNCTDSTDCAFHTLILLMCLVLLTNTRAVFYVARVNSLYCVEARLPLRLHSRLERARL